MSRTARLTATFVPLLSPPLQVSLQTLKWLVRPRPSFRASLRPQQCRYLQLYKTATARTVVGQHKILPFSEYELPPLENSEHKINIVEWVDGQGTEEESKTREKKMVAEDLTLKEAYDRFLEPGKILTPAETVGKQWVRSEVDAMQQLKTPEKFKDYVITKPYGPDHLVSVNFTTVKGQRGSAAAKQLINYKEIRGIHLILHSPTDYWQMMLDKAYQFIELGCPVEFVIRARMSGDTKKQKLRNAGTKLMDYYLAHFPHMRPDFILRSMPSGTEYIIDPFSDGRALQFVLARPIANRPDLNERLRNVKATVEEAVEGGRMKENLPRMLRNRSSSQDFSKETVKPERASDTSDAAELEQALHRTLDQSRYRYMVPKNARTTTAEQSLRLEETGKGYEKNAWVGQREDAEGTMPKKNIEAKQKRHEQAHVPPPAVVEANRRRQRQKPSIIPQSAIEANRQRQKLNPSVAEKGIRQRQKQNPHAIPPEVVEANRQRQKEAMKRSREAAEAWKERARARNANHEEKGTFAKP